MDDHRLVKWLLLILLLPIGLAMCSGDRFRYACQDPANWDKDICKPPLCEVSRTCPDQIFKGGRDPRNPAPQQSVPATPPTTGAVCK